MPIDERESGSDRSNRALASRGSREKDVTCDSMTDDLRFTISTSCPFSPVFDERPSAKIDKTLGKANTIEEIVRALSLRRIFRRIFRTYADEKICLGEASSVVTRKKIPRATVKYLLSKQTVDLLIYLSNTHRRRRRRGLRRRALRRVKQVSEAGSTNEVRLYNTSTKRRNPL